MRVRINEHLTIAGDSLGSDIYRRFKAIFDIVLAGTSPGIVYQSPEQWYVPIPELEDELRSTLFRTSVDVAKFLVGHTGIGKSTVLQHVIGSDQNIYHKDTKTYIIYISLNPRRIEEEGSWTRSFCGDLRSASDDLHSMLGIPTLTNADLAAFIRNNSPRVLNSVDIMIGTDDLTRLEALFKTNRRYYELEYIKLLCAKEPVNHLCIVVDDLESLSHKLQMSVVLELFSSFRCLQRLNPRKHTVSLLIAVRPNTYASLRALGRDRVDAWTSNGRDLTPYTFETVDFNDPVGLHDLLEARFKTAVNSVDIHAIPKGDWTEAKNICEVITKKLDNRYGKDIVALANANIRESLEYFVSILKNRTWFQKNMAPNAAFQIDALDYAVNDAGIMRCLAMPRSHMYFDTNEVPVANLLHNTPEANGDLLVSYVLRFLLRRNEKISYASIWKAQDLQVCVEVCERLFGKEGSVLPFEGIFDWMCSRGLLWRLDPDDHRFLFSLPPRAVKTWDLLKKNAILLQCFREDTYREFNSIKNRYATKNIPIVDLYMDCISFVQEIADRETMHISVAKLRNSVPLMRDTFGLNVLSRQLYLGLRNSFHQFYGEAADAGTSIALPDELGEPFKTLGRKITGNLAVLKDGISSEAEGQVDAKSRVDGMD